MKKRYWSIDAKCGDPDEMSWRLIELGAEGVELISIDTVRAFFSGTDAELARFKSGAEAEDFILSACSPIEDKNWLQDCRQLYEIVEVGTLRIVPISDSGVTIEDENPRRDIVLIPGQGFGTGHHQTTRQILRLLQASDLAAAKPGRILDFGTGSGILAIAAAKLFGAAVDAIDISEPALENARENAERNGVAESVRFAFTAPEPPAGGYDLITANLYAEVLTAHEKVFSAAVRRGGRLLAAGILEQFADEVLSVYDGWKLLDRRRDDEWVALSYEKY